MLHILLLAACLGTVVSVFHLLSGQRLKSGLKRLPGPRGIPYVGVPHKLVASKQWLQMTEWSKEYGPIYQTQIMGEQLVIVSDDKVHNELLMKKRSQFGDRPEFSAMPWIEDSMVYPPLTKSLAKAKHVRKIMLQLLASIPRAQLTEACKRSAKDFVHALHADPSNAQKLCEESMSRITCDLFYAAPDVAARNCYASATLLRVVSPGNQVGSKLPILAKLWTIIPDALQPWKAYEVARRQEERAFWLKNFHRGRNAAAAGTWTVVGELDRLQQSEKKDTFAIPGPFEDIGDSADVLGMLAIIGSLLLSTTLQMTIVAMCHHPHWQAKVAEELDRACPGRLPVPSDMPSLPIFRAIIREVHRWRPAVPTSAPHTNPEVVEYNGYEIPAGASVLSLIWTKERNPELYPQAEEFRPERWLESGWPTYTGPLSQYPKLKGIPSFGWGERRCVGEEYVDWLNVIMIGALLKTTVVGKKRDEVSGEELDIDTMKFDDHTIFIKPKAWPMEAGMRSEEAMKCLDA